MRQIVTGLYETYDDARRAQDALLLKGFAVTDIELPVPGSAADTATGGAHGGGLIAGIERFVASLFSGSHAPSATPGPTGTSASDEAARAASLRFALQRGAVLIGVHVLDDAHAAVARDTLVQQQAIQVDTHASDWRLAAPDPDTMREHSALDELGIGGIADALRDKHGETASATGVPDDATLRARYDALRETELPPSPPGRPDDDAAVTALASASAPGAGAVMSGGVGERDVSASAQPLETPDEYVEYEEDFRGHHAAHYSEDDVPFERYQNAYRYGAGLAQDAQYQGRSWDDIELDARRGWETRTPGIAPLAAWHDVRDAVRHGWERATGRTGSE